MTREAIILAGGLGTRLQKIVSDVPKPMAQIINKPFLLYLFQYLKHFGIEKIILAVGHKNEIIRDYFKDQFESIKINYAIEENLLGTGGGLKNALLNCEEEEVLVLNGDSFFDIDLNAFWDFHQNHNSNFSLALREVEDSSRFGTIQINSNQNIISFKEKNGQTEKGIINAGIYLVNRSLFLKECENLNSFSLEKDFLEIKLKDLNINGKIFQSYFIDIGVPEDFQKAQHDFKGFAY